MAKQRNTSTRAAAVVQKDKWLYVHLPYLINVSDTIIRTRDDGFFQSFEITGIDGLTASDGDIEALRDQMSELLLGLDEQYTFYIHRIMRPLRTKLEPVKGNSFESDVDLAWSDHIAKRGLREPMLVMSVLRNNSIPIPVPFFKKSATRLLGQSREKRIAQLKELTSYFKDALNLDTCDLTISSGEMLGFLNAITTGGFQLHWRGDLTLIAEDVANVSPVFKDDIIAFTDGNEGRTYATVLVIKSFSKHTHAGFLDALGGVYDTVVTHSFTPISNAKIAVTAKIRIEQMQAADDLATSVAEELAETYDNVETGKVGFGEYHLAVTVFAASAEELDVKVSGIVGVAAQSKLTLVRDSANLEGNYFAAHIGNKDYQWRTELPSTLNFADATALHTPGLGVPADKLPWKTPVTLLETANGSAHRFSFHKAGDPEAEPTNGHTLVLGPSEGGKTTTTLFLLTQARRTGSRLFLFDKDQGMKMAIDAMGGQYAKINAGHATGLNPLVTETGERGEAWLLSWLTALLEHNSKPLTPKQVAALKNAIRQNCRNAPLEDRNFRQFITLVNDVDDDNDLRNRIAEWGPDGRYNWVFGEADTPVVDFKANPVTAIDLTEILKSPVERTAVMAYLFRRMEVLFEERVPTIVAIDEAWQVLDDEYFSRWLEAFLVVSRKLNVVFVMLTQFASQIRKSKSSRTLLEALPNQILFPSNRAEIDGYEGFGLTDNETAFLTDGRHKGRIALLRSHTQSTLLDVDLSPLGPLLTVLGGGRAGWNKFGEDYATRPYFWRTQNED